MDKELNERAGRIIAAYARAGRTIATAESCTGGLVAACLTSIPGSSAVLDRGFVTYSNAAKAEMIGVPAALIIDHGAVSREVACAMAEGALHVSGASVAVAITGIAGPGGGTSAKPVGLVHFAVATTAATAHRVHGFGDLGRDEIRRRSVIVALEVLEEAIQAPETAGERP